MADGEKQKKRFTVPAGKEALFQVDPIRDPSSGYLRWGVDSEVGTPNGAQVILTGAKPPSEQGLITGRAVEKSHIKKIDGVSSLFLGETKVPNVMPGSALVLFELQPQENVQVLNMPKTIIVAEKSGVQKAGSVGYTNTLPKVQQVVLVIPPQEHNMKLGASLKAHDFETIHKYIEGYTNQNPSRNPFGMKPDDALKMEIFPKLEALIDNTKQAIENDLEARKEEPKRPAIYSDLEIKIFSSAMYQETLKSKKKTTLPKGLLERFEVDVVPKQEALEKKSEEMGANHHGAPEADGARLKHAYTAADALKNQLQESLQLAGAKSTLPDDLIGGFKKPGGSLTPG